MTPYGRSRRRDDEPRKMKSKFDESECEYCEVPILRDDWIYYSSDQGAWHAEHGMSGRDRDVAIRHGAPPAESKGVESKGDFPTGPPATLQDEPIFTYHRRVTTGDGMNDWAEWGVAVKGRTLSQADQESLDNLVRTTLKNRNQWGEIIR